MSKSNLKTALNELGSQFVSELRTNLKDTEPILVIFELLYFNNVLKTNPKNKRLKPGKPGFSGILWSSFEPPIEDSKILYKALRKSKLYTTPAFCALPGTPAPYRKSELPANLVIKEAIKPNHASFILEDFPEINMLSILEDKIPHSLNYKWFNPKYLRNKS